MPLVGGKKYPYSKAGIAAAKRAAKRLGKKVTTSRKTKSLKRTPVKTRRRSSY